MSLLPDDQLTSFRMRKKQSRDELVNIVELGDPVRDSYRVALSDVMPDEAGQYAPSLISLQCQSQT